MVEVHLSSISETGLLQDLGHMGVSSSARGLRGIAKVL